MCDICSPIKKGVGGRAVKLEVSRHSERTCNVLKLVVLQ